ncbi:MAG: metallophosphoesterase, partial [Waddliaceae bacterium]
PHKFALYHVPAYPCVRKFKGMFNIQIRRHWVPIFENFGLTAAFEHHDHAYKRTHLIYRERIDPKGVLYLGDGGWGVKRARKPRSAGSLWYLAKTARARHFIMVTLDGGNRHYTAIDSKGNVIDTYSQTSTSTRGSLSKYVPAGN